MIFQHTLDKVLSGEKTQTRRIVKPGETFEPADPICGYPAGVYCWKRNFAQTARPVYIAGKTYAVQPGRNEFAHWYYNGGEWVELRICVTDIRREDVREISDEDVQAEGYESHAAFWLTWCKRYDSFLFKPGQLVMSKVLSAEHMEREMMALMKARPAAQYDAWVLTFEVV